MELTMLPAVYDGAPQTVPEQSRANTRQLNLRIRKKCRGGRSFSGNFAVIRVCRVRPARATMADMEPVLITAEGWKIVYHQGTMVQDA